MNNNSNVFNLNAHSKRNGGRKATNTTVGFLKRHQYSFLTFIIDGAMIHVYQSIRSSASLKVYVQNGCSTDRPKKETTQVKHVSAIKQNRDGSSYIIKFTYKKIKEMKNEGSNLIKQIPWRMFTVIRKKGGCGLRNLHCARSSGFPTPSLYIYKYIYENLYLQ